MHRYNSIISQLNISKKTFVAANQYPGLQLLVKLHKIFPSGEFIYPCLPGNASDTGNYLFCIKECSGKQEISLL